MRNILLSVAVTAMFVCPVFAGEAKVTWQAPEKYSDIRPGNDTRDAFQARVFKELEVVFTDLAKQLPDAYQLEITVTDLDLAGDVNGMYGDRFRDIRVIKELYWPRMSLSYALKNPDNALIASGKDDIKDMNFMSRISIPSGNTNFIYEETMLRDWFAKKQTEKVFPKK
jgi:hypothetical protein